MKQSSFLFFLGFFLLSGVCVAKQESSIALQTTPAGCSFVFMNHQGKKVASGKTPFISKLPNGQYHLTVRCSGYFVDSRVLKIEKDKILAITLMKSQTPSKSQSPSTDKKDEKKVDNKATTSGDVVKKAKKKTETNKEKPTNTNKTVDSKKLKAQKNGNKQKVKLSKNGKTITIKAKRKVPWIPIALGGGLIVGGAVFMGLSQGNLSESKNKSMTQVLAYETYKKGLDQRQTSMYLFVAGGLAGGLAAVMYFWGRQSKGKKKKNFFSAPKLSSNKSPSQPYFGSIHEE